MIKSNLILVLSENAILDHFMIVWGLVFGVDIDRVSSNGPRGGGNVHIICYSFVIVFNINSIYIYDSFMDVYEFW